MMFGYRDEFTYMECSNCGCLQIANQPASVDKYYASEYFALKEIAPSAKSDSMLTKYLLKKWIAYGLEGDSVLGRLISRIKPVPLLYRVFRQYNIDTDSAILDVGCGNGTFLMNLHRAGFKHLLGVDPFLPSALLYDDRLTLLNIGLEHLDQQFDLITCNHSFEHMAEPFKVLDQIFSLLNEDGLLIIRIPLIGYAWRHYGIHWVQLDAPRHFFLHTAESINITFKKARFDLIGYAYDSDEFQFWGSEQYRRNIHLMDAKSFWITHDDSLFSEVEMRSFRLRAAELNKQNDGDQASFYLKKQKHQAV